MRSLGTTEEGRLVMPNRPAPATAPSCPRCRTSHIEEEDQSGSSARWFVCNGCGHRWQFRPSSATSPSPRRSVAASSLLIRGSLLRATSPGADTDHVSRRSALNFGVSSLPCESLAPSRPAFLDRDPSAPFGPLDRQLTRRSRRLEPRIEPARAQQLPVLENLTFNAVQLTVIAQFDADLGLV